MRDCRGFGRNPDCSIMSRRHRCIYPDRKRCLICGKRKPRKRSS